MKNTKCQQNKHTHQKILSTRPLPWGSWALLLFSPNNNAVTLFRKIILFCSDTQLTPGYRWFHALRAAVQKLEKGCSLEYAKAVCGPELLSEMMKWKNKLRVYLAPFLHGMRYTSFGRHFTKLDKLEKVVSMLHWYAQDGDMIVDFCCGANDFSCLMKKRLNEVGKKCSYKNYDVIQPKNDFNFEQRDWMSVQLNELPSGSRLIMGLSPPFGFEASLANKFINKALKFKPKLLVLIVPQKTERLDKKNPPYDLVFEDNELLAGKSFYLPGSVDINDKQMDHEWYMSPLPLSFWSHRDWTSKHKAIAQQHGDLYRGQEVSHMVDNQKENQKSKRFLPSLSQAVESLETLPLADVGNESNQHFDGRVSEPHKFGAGYTGTWEDNMARRYGSIGGEPYQSSTYRNRFSEEHILGYQRESVENRGYMSYTSSTSTMQRYAPRLDELNYSRMNSLRSEPPSMTRSGVYDPLAPRPLYQGQGFPPGPYFR